MLLRRLIIMLGAVLLVVLLLAGYKAFSVYQQIQVFSAPKPPINISAATAEQRPWQERLSGIGSLSAYQGIELTVEIAGTVRDLLFSSGQKVAQGQPLLQMDDAVERASLEAAEADLTLARVEFERGRSLVSRQMISKSDFDRLSAQLQKNTGTVAQLKASLAKKRIVAPFAGTIGIRQVDIGDYLDSGTTIAPLQDLSRLYVDFFLPEQEVPRLAIEQQVQLTVAAWPGETFEGRIEAINPKVDEQTRTVQVRASLPNPDERLLPGMFANLEVLLPETPRRIVLPETALTYTLYGNSVYVIAPKPGEDGQTLKDEQGQEQLFVQRRFVETGDHRGGEVVILKGIEAGERVVSTGQLKLDNGAHVAIVDDHALPLDSDGQSGN